jgi:hypothetical protein
MRQVSCGWSKSGGSDRVGDVRVDHAEGMSEFGRCWRVVNGEQRPEEACTARMSQGLEQGEPEQLLITLIAPHGDEGNLVPLQRPICPGPNSPGRPPNHQDLTRQAHLVPREPAGIAIVLINGRQP